MGSGLIYCGNYGSSQKNCNTMQLSCHPERSEGSHGPRRFFASLRMTARKERCSFFATTHSTACRLVLAPHCDDRQQKLRPSRYLRPHGQVCGRHSLIQRPVGRRSFAPMSKANHRDGWPWSDVRQRRYALQNAQRPSCCWSLQPVTKTQSQFSTYSPICLQDYSCGNGPSFRTAWACRA